LPFTIEEADFLDVQIWLKDERNNLVRLDEVDFQSRLGALEDVYSSIIQVEGWTIDVDVVNLHDNRFENAYHGSVSKPCNGIHVRYISSRGTLYSKLYSHDTSRVELDDCTFMALIPSSAEQHGDVMLLKKVDSHYERVGLFSPTWCWTWDKAGKLQLLQVTEGGSSIGIESTRQRFQLG
jgi:hypothetical protein